MADGRWTEIMTWITSNPYRPLVLIVLAQEQDSPVDEFNIARQVGMINQQMSGKVVETAVIVKEIRDLREAGYVELAGDNFRWRLTELGSLVSRQWVPGDVEPEGSGPFDTETIQGWRDRVVLLLERDAETARAADIEQNEWAMTQTPRLVEMHVLNRVLGEDRVPSWLSRMSYGGDDPEGSDV
ncbi:hypothetical protein BH23CHL2_BH23CHL2_00770 [soil metagenome]